MGAKVRRPMQTARCTLRFPGPQDAPGIWSAIQAPEFRDVLNLAQAGDLAEIQRRVVDMCADSEKGHSYTWLVERDGGLIGLVELSPEPEPRTWLLSYWITPANWGCGFATEVAARVLQLAFDELAAESVWAGAATWNTARGGVV